MESACEIASDENVVMFRVARKMMLNVDYVALELDNIMLYQRKRKKKKP